MNLGTRPEAGPGITVGSYGLTVIKRAVTLGDSLHEGNLPVAPVAPLVAQIKDAARAAGRDHATPHIVSLGSYGADDTARGRRPLWSTLAEIHEAIRRYASEEVRSLPEEHRTGIWNQLEELIAKHTKFSEAEWAMGTEQVQGIAAVARILAPQTPALRHRRPFSEQTFWLDDAAGDYEGQQSRLEDERFMLSDPRGYCDWSGQSDEVSASEGRLLLPLTGTGSLHNWL